jgi:hypothetical protein
MTSHYETKDTWGAKISLEHNNSRSGASGHNVLVTAEATFRDDIVYASVKGEKTIREFLYNFAVIGGIIKEGETLSIDEPSDRDVPNDGTYKLTGASESRQIAIVQGGRVMVPQPEDGTIIDYTDVYLSKYSQWELTPLEKAERSVRTNA